MMENYFKSLLIACFAIGIFAMCSESHADSGGGVGNLPEAPEPSKPISFLKAVGTVLCNEEGDTIQLKGTNLGSYLSFEQWMSPCGYGPLDRKVWDIKVSSANVDNPEISLVDNDQNTYWLPQREEKGEQWFELELADNEVFNSVRLNVKLFNKKNSYKFKLYKLSADKQWELINEYGGQISDNRVEINLGDFIQTTGIRIVADAEQFLNFSVTEVYLAANDAYHIYKSFINRFGMDGYDDLMDYYCSKWIQLSDVEFIRSMGLNVVRIPFFWMEILDEQGYVRDMAFRRLDNIVRLCKEHNLYVILDLHCSPGGNDGYVTSGMAIYNEVWNNPRYQEMTVDLWKAVAGHFKDEPTVACYDALNESWSNSERFTNNDLYKLIYTAIRSVDQRHVICFQGFPNFDFVASPVENNWENVMYQAHYYNTDYHNETSQKGFAEAAISEMVRIQQRWNVPVLAGEFSFWEHEDVWKRFFNGLNSMNVSWTNWSYKSRESNSARANFAFYTDLNVADPDLIEDSQEEIKLVWDKITSDRFYKNMTLVNLVRNHTRNRELVEKDIYIQQWDGKYLTLSADGALKFSTLKREEAAKFSIVKAEDGHSILLKAENGKYMSVDKTSKRVSCTANDKGETELLSWIRLDVQEFALWGCTGFVSCNGGDVDVVCDRDKIDGWERFVWQPAN